jgi:MFS transporter, DHA3 family, macrolide efflux protein
MPPPRPSGLGGFFIIWIGQVISILGSGMSQFALTIWAYQLTGEATALALVGFFSYAPGVFVGPIAGALVDRWNRKLVMAISDLAAGLSTIFIFFLFQNGQLEIWHLCVAGAISSVFGSFQWPAFSAAMSVLVPKEQYGRVNGAISMAESATGIGAPVLAGIALAVIGIGGVLLIDIVTFIVAVCAIFFVAIPNPPVTAEGKASQANFWQDTIFGFRFIWRRKGLLGVQTTFAISNFFFGIGMVLANPMVLARSGSNEGALAAVQSMLGVGGVAGGLLMSAWGGPKRRVLGVLWGFILGSIFGTVIFGIGQSLPLWLVGAFFTMFFMPLINGSNQSLWQAKVAPGLQGRVFSVRRLIAQVTGPVGTLMAGPLADQLFEPALQPGGAWAPLFGPLVGTGPGAGMGLLIAITGVLGITAGVVGLSIPVIRMVDSSLPDHDALPEDGAALQP